MVNGKKLKTVMIQIARIQGIKEDGGIFHYPQRSLTKQELRPVDADLNVITKDVIIAQWGDDNWYFYYQAKDRESNTPEWQAYQAYINPPETLDEIKKKKTDQIDERTQAIILKGFLYGGEYYSNSDRAQGNWNKIVIGKATGTALETDFPIPLSTLDNKKVMLEYANIEEFYRTFLLSISAAKFSGSILKQQVLDCITIEQVLGIIDSRE